MSSPVGILTKGMCSTIAQLTGPVAKLMGEREIIFLILMSSTVIRSSLRCTRVLHIYIYIN